RNASSGHARRARWSLLGSAARRSGSSVRAPALPAQSWGEGRKGGAAPLRGKRREVAVTLRQATRDDQDGHVPSCPRESKIPISPWGKNITTAARIAPNTKRQYWVTDITWSWRTMKTKAPTTGPKKFPKPPSSSMKTRLPEWVQ